MTKAATTTHPQLLAILLYHKPRGTVSPLNSEVGCHALSRRERVSPDQTGGTGREAALGKEQPIPADYQQPQALGTIWPAIRGRVVANALPPPHARIPTGAGTEG